eukprot:m.303552 g.303552  ORF g.303552 m.303552 type:complete len:294 (+) comp15985_c0_seq1:3-884(+)
MSHRKRKSGAASTQWAFLLPREANGDVEFVSLPHPRTGEAARFMLAQDPPQLFEVQRFEDTVPRSFLIGNTVQQDGALFVVTPVDPVFLLLPILAKQKDRAVPLDHLLVSDKFPALRRLEHARGLEQLNLFCEVKGGGIAFLLDQARLLRWLKAKTERLAAHLSSSRIAGSAATNTAFKIKASSQCSPEQSLALSYGIVCEYLSDELAKELKASLPELILGGEESAATATAAAAPPKLYKDAEAVDDYTKFNTDNTQLHQAKKVKLTPAQRALAKVDKRGMGSIASFFKKKTK